MSQLWKTVSQVATPRKSPRVGGQNRVDLAFSRFFPSLKGVLGPKSGQNLGKIRSIWHIFPFWGLFFVLCLLAFGDTVSKCLFLLVFGKPPKSQIDPILPIYSPPVVLHGVTRTLSNLLSEVFGTGANFIDPHLQP